ncbi:hypothetical protein SAMN05421858_0016 [Haladaptatus litoreus]|uniref:Uncharacterized protein n=1 Tax=Haladaptatus litoreus TaxID=553468 RepID=A0A1N6UM92_9EURY|nr:hypothetical protein [Haladaptatus litoreus]SIQ66765.1 hypothetical protein SAMN05421858_0016 [Haladaptatus litoreus]
MALVDEQLVDDIAKHDRYYRIEDFVTYLERHLRDEPGVPLSVIHAYADALGYERERTDELLEGRIVDSMTWVADDVFYRIGDGISIYPLSWHERLDGSRDVADYVRVMLDGREAAGKEFPKGERGIAQTDILTALEIMADVDRKDGEKLLREQRHQGDIVIYAYQNPEDIVRLPETKR